MKNNVNKSGFSLIEMVIAMSLASGLVVFLMRMQSEQAKNAKTIQVNIEVETFFSNFKAIIVRPAFCNKSFENMTLLNNSYASTQSIKNARGDIQFQVGEKYGSNSLVLKGITINNFKPDDVDELTGLANLELSIERLGKIYGAKMIKKSMLIDINRNKQNLIIACGALSASDLKIEIVVPTKKEIVNESINEASIEPVIETSKKSEQEINTEQLQQMLKSLQQQQKAPIDINELDIIE